MAPATAGVAMDVPDSSRVLLSPELLALVIFAPAQIKREKMGSVDVMKFPSKRTEKKLSIPGAQISTQEPILLNPAALSLISVAATVIAKSAPAGDLVQLSAPKSFPAATTTGIPAETTASTASSSDLERSPPRERLATAGHPPFAATS